MAISLLLVLCSALLNMLVQTQGQGALGQTVDFQGECRDSLETQVSIIERQLSLG